LKWLALDALILNLPVIHTMADSLSLKNIELASTVIDPVFLKSPLFRHDELDTQLGAGILLKIETLNPIRSFKGRGTDFFVRRLPQNTRPLVAASAGNFGQGLAYAARKIGLPITIFAAANANTAKIAAMRRLGAEVLLAGDDFDAAKAHAKAHADSTGALFTEDGAHPAFAEGAGTIAREFTEAGFIADAFLVPLGNGSLITGIGAWLKHAAPQTRVIGVVAEGAPAMKLSFLENRIVETSAIRTIADGIAVRVPVPAIVEAMSDTVDEVLAVDDQAMLQAMKLVLYTVGLVVEPAGIVGLAAILSNLSRFRGQKLATVLCGGNLTSGQMHDWLQVDQTVKTG